LRIDLLCVSNNECTEEVPFFMTKLVSVDTKPQEEGNKTTLE